MGGWTLLQDEQLRPGGSWAGGIEDRIKVYHLEGSVTTTRFLYVLWHLARTSADQTLLTK